MKETFHDVIDRASAPALLHGVTPGRPPQAPSVRHHLLDLLRLMGAHVGDGFVPQHEGIVLRRISAGSVLFHEGDRADTIHIVALGTFKSYRTAEDGYEQVLDFPGRADVLGFDAVCMAHHPTGAAALEDSQVYALPTNEVIGSGPRLAALDPVLHMAVSRQLQRRCEIAYMMAAVSAEVRLARFLMQWSDRMASCGQSPRRLWLRMNRRDIASHLGMAHETVSRCFGTLGALGLLKVQNRDIEIVDLDGLAHYALVTRGINEA